MFYEKPCPEGHGFMRLNVGAPRALLQQALKQLSDAIGQQ